MSIADKSPDDPFKIRNKAALDGGIAEDRLKRHLGQGVYVQEIDTLPSGNLEVTLGNASPRDLSDCRDKDNVLKFVTLRDVYTIEAESTGSGYYVIDVPDRSDVIEGIDEREQEILDKMDFSMAQAIYQHVYDLPAVRTQLNPILQILRGARNRSGLTVENVYNHRGKQKGAEYIELLEVFGYIKVEDGNITPGGRLRSADLHEYGWDEFGRKFLGDVVQRGFYTMRDELDLNMLAHYQKYTGAYYFDAIQRGKEDLWLDMEALSENLDERYNDSKDEFYLHDKFGELDSVGVIRKDGEYVRSEPEIFEQVARDTPTA